jgi:hypothetical protein
MRAAESGKMSTTTTMPRATRKLLSTLIGALALTTLAETAGAQEILLTGPLAGAPAARKLRLYREGRFEIAPTATFTLLDEYQRTILFGGRLTYHFWDWLGVGVWGGYGAVKSPTHLSGEIQKVNADRWAGDANPPNSPDRRLTAVNLSHNFENQLTGLDWIASPQLTLVPFRGKIALFESIHVDTDLYFFGGPAFVGINERGNCEEDCSDPASFKTKSRMAIAPSGGLGLSFYLSEWAALGFNGRVAPFSWNAAGFDVAGSGKDKKFSDRKINSEDRQMKANMMMTVSLGIYLPTDVKLSE